MGGSTSARRIATSDNARDGSLLAADTRQRRPLSREVFDLLKLAFPIFMNMVAWVGMKVTDTAVLGHVGTRYLDASALSDLWTQSSGVFIQSQVVGTFCGQAFGAGNKQLVGIWLQVSYVVLMSTMLPVFVLWCLTGTVLRALGKTSQESSDAQYYAAVLAICLPVRIGFSQLTQFFSSQKIMRPSVVCATCSLVTNLFGGLILVLGLGIPGWNGLGFAACPWVTTTVEYLQLFVLWFVFCHVKKLHLDCWPGWSREHVTRERVMTFVKMYIPAALAIGSDFWRVAAIGAVASNLGPINLAVFNAGYRIAWICITWMGALAGAVGIQLNIALGQGSAHDAKRTAMVGIGVAVVCVSVLGGAVVCFPRSFGGIFSNDAEFLDLFEECRWPFAAFAVLMNLGTNIEKIPMSAGRVNAVFYAGLAGSWLGQVPGVLLCTMFWRKDLVGLYTGVAAGYGLLTMLYLAIILRMDWEQVALEARHRSEASKRLAQESGASLQPAGRQESGASLQPPEPQDLREGQQDGGA